MKNASYAFIACTCVLAAVCLFQFKQSSDLKQQNEELIAAADTRSTSINFPGRDNDNRPTNSRSTINSGAHTRGIKDLLAIKDPTKRTEALLDYVKKLSASEIPDAIVELRRSTPHWDQEGKFFAHMLLSKWARLDPDAALASLNEVDMKRYGDAPFSVISSISSQDPQRAITWLNDDQNPFASNKWMGQFLAGTISKEWVKQDPEAALAWAQSVPDDQRIGALTGVLGSIAMTDPKRAAQLAMEIEPGKGREFVVADIAQSWAAKDPRGALAWVEKLTADERPNALNNTLAIWARTEPESAAKYVTNHLDEDNSNKLVKSVTDAWVGKAPDEAAKWISTLPVDKKGAEAMSDAMWHWTNKNPEAAATWLADQPASPVRDQGITGLAKASFEFDKAAALSWTREISDDKTRNFSTAIGLKAWAKEDPQAASQWASDNGVAMPKDDGKK